MADIYEQLGVEPIINAKGPSTRLSGGRMRPEVAAAMAEAAQSCVDILALQARASEIIAGHTGAEAGLVTAGAAAALLLGTAAGMTGLDPAAMAHLPDLRSRRDQAVMVRSQRNQYDHALRTAGVEIIAVGLADRFAGAGCRDAEPWEIDAAISERTALVHYVAGPTARPPLEAVVHVAHARGVPVLVDAAAQLPPKANLRRFIATGADLVAFSGGKAIGGPQASGILCGRRDLVAAAALQMLDMDYPEGVFEPPACFIDVGRLRGLPPHGIGRPCKVGKEQIVGLLAALDLFVLEDDACELRRQVALLEELAAGLDPIVEIAVSIRREDTPPVLVLEFRRNGTVEARDLLLRLARGRPAIHPDPREADQGRLLFSAACLGPLDPPRIAGQLRDLLAAGAVRP
jgi:D-glucosaminate-6-phosphate ammonia-lyase